MFSTNWTRGRAEIPPWGEWSPSSSDWSINFQFKVSDQNNCHSIKDKNHDQVHKKLCSEWNPELGHLTKRGRKNENSTRRADDIHRFLWQRLRGMTRSKWKVENNNLSGAKVMINLLTHSLTTASSWTWTNYTPGNWRLTCFFVLVNFSILSVRRKTMISLWAWQDRIFDGF